MAAPPRSSLGVLKHPHRQGGEVRRGAGEGQRQLLEPHQTKNPQAGPPASALQQSRWMRLSTPEPGAAQGLVADFVDAWGTAQKAAISPLDMPKSAPRNPRSEASRGLNRPAAHRKHMQGQGRAAAGTVVAHARDKNESWAQPGSGLQRLMIASNRGRDAVITVA